MQGFILKRVLFGAVTLFALTVVVFVLARTTGDPVLLMLGQDASDEAIADLQRHLGLDQPYPTQYWLFINGLARGDLGESLRYRRPALDLVKDRLPNSLKLGAVAMMFALLLSFPLGIAAAVRRGTWIDQGARMVSVLGVTMPGFLVGILVMELFAVRLRLLPTSGMGGPEHYILPGFTMSLFVLASMTRLLRSSMIEALGSEYIKLARLKGISEWLVVWKHALRNSVIPVLTLGGIFLAAMVTVGVIVETVFSWPGIGRLSYDAIVGRDFPVIQAVVIMAGGLVISANLLVDVAYALVDPRIRQQ